MDCTAYSRQCMKVKLIESYDDSLYIAEKDGEQDVVTMMETVTRILRSYYKNKEDVDETRQKFRIIEAAARLMNSDVKSDVYPSTSDIDVEKSLQYLSDSVRLFCCKLFVGKDIRTKVASISQSIVKAVRPCTVIVPLQLGLAIQLHHHYRTRFVIDTLHAMDFASSYHEVQWFKRNAACVSGDDILGNVGQSNILLGADNVYHNIITLNGDDTFHGMGMIAAITPGHTIVREIPRKISSECSVTEAAKIYIHEYLNACEIQSHVTFQVLPQLIEDFSTVDVLWEVSCRLKKCTLNGQV